MENSGREESDNLKFEEEIELLLLLELELEFGVELEERLKLDLDLDLELEEEMTLSLTAFCFSASHASGSSLLFSVQSALNRSAIKAENCCFTCVLSVVHKEEEVLKSGSLAQRRER